MSQVILPTNNSAVMLLILMLLKWKLWRWDDFS